MISVGLVSILEHISPFGVVSMAQRLRSSVTAMHLCAVLALCLLLFGSKTGRSALTAHHSHDNDLGITMSNCPLECDCRGLTVDCSNRGLQNVPRLIPPEVRRL